MAEQNSISVLAVQLANAFGRLEALVSDEGKYTGLLQELGWSSAILPTPVTDLLSPLGALADALGDGEITTDELSGLLTALTDLITAIENLASANPSAFETDLISDDFLGTFPTQLVHYLIVEFVNDEFPFLGNLLSLMGVFRTEYREANGNRTAYLYRKIHWSAITEFLSSPHDALSAAFAWGTESFDSDQFLEFLMDGFDAVGLPVSFTEVEDDMLTVLENGASITDDPVRWALKIPIFEDGGDVAEAEFGLMIFILPKAGALLPGLALIPYASGDFSVDIELSETLSLKIEAGFDLDNGIAAMIRPDGSGISVDLVMDILSGAGDSFSNFTISLENSADEEALVIIGGSESSRLEAKSVALRTGAYGGGSGNVELFTEFDLQGGKLVIQPGEDSDGFISKVFPEDGVDVDFGLGFGWSNQKGIYFRGSAGLEVNIPVQSEFLGISVNDITISAGIEDSALPIDLSTNVSGELGPVAFTVDGIGFTLDMAFPGSGGNLGPMDLALGFKPPTGIGLSIDAQGFKGGGFLFLDNDKGEYSGGIELQFQNLLTLAAIGIITTKDPDGNPGFSLLISISAEFTPIQLGFGFTLNGVGGLLGDDRSMDLDALREGVKTGANDNILFPTDIVANAEQIISDMNEIFPIENEQFVFGPMAKFGWGTPTLITVDLGLLIEVPAPVTIAILGVVKAVLPDKDAAILKLQVNFLGAIDFEAGLISFDATIYDSKLLTFTLSGDMAFRLSYGSDPNFLLSVGGFHPSYTPPPLSLPDMYRLTIKLLSGNNPRLTIETYFAVTSNTVQLGAKAEVYAEAWKIYVLGYVSFDALFQFSPFYFIISVAAMVEVGLGNKVLFSVSLSMSLEGPTPWKTDGTASFKVLAVKVNVNFQTTWGDKKDTSLPDIAVLPELMTELENQSNWMAELPGHSQLSVTLNEIDTSTGQIIAHPAGVLKLNQKAVPLDMSIEKYGNQRPSDANKFMISAVTTGSGGDEVAMDTSTLTEYFAPAQFEELSDSNKLSRNSFEKMNSGVEMSGASTLKSEDYVYRPVEYERIIIDEENNRIELGKYKLSGAVFSALVKGSAVAQQSYSYEKTRKSALAPEGIGISQEGYSVTSVEDLSAWDAGSSLGSEAEATAYMKDLIATDPSLADVLQVVPNYEMSTL